MRQKMVALLLASSHAFPLFMQSKIVSALFELAVRQLKLATYWLMLQPYSPHIIFKEHGAIA